MIAPMTGNGMSMAFESAEIAIEPLTAYSNGSLSWSAAQKKIARACDVTFSRRLAWAAQLQRFLFVTRAQDSLVAYAPRWKWLWRLLLNRTR
jgi:flavin-dependent dehydrogenase